MQKILSNYFALALLIIFPVTVLLLNITPGLIFVIAMFWGCYLYFNQKIIITTFSREEKLFFLAFIPLYISAWLSAYFNDTGIYHADRFLTLYMIIPIYIFVKNTVFNEKALWIGLFLGCLSVSIFALYQSYALDVYRVTGVTHPIFFGSMSIFMGGLSLLSFRRWKGWFWQAAPFLAFVMGVTSAVLSGSRISLVILIVYLVMTMIFSFINRLVSRKIIISSAVVAALVLILIYSSSSYVKTRIDSAVTHTVEAMQTTDVNNVSRHTSEGLRFEMWKAAWRMFKENPYFGVGWGEFNKHSKVMIKEGFVTQVIDGFNQPHNEYFSALSRGGIVGFLSVLLVFLIPLYLFYRGSCQNKNNQIFAFGGLIYVLGFMILSITADPFQSSRSILSFSFYVAVLMALMNKENANKNIN